MAANLVIGMATELHRIYEAMMRAYAVCALSVCCELVSRRNILFLNYTCNPEVSDWLVNGNKFIRMRAERKPSCSSHKTTNSWVEKTFSALHRIHSRQAMANFVASPPPPHTTRRQKNRQRNWDVECVAGPSMSIMRLRNANPTHNATCQKYMF